MALYFTVPSQDQSGLWLGFVLYFESGKHFVPETKMSKLCTTVDSVFLSTHMHARILVSIVGQIISMSLAIGPVAHLRTRASSFIQCA